MKNIEYFSLTTKWIVFYVNLLDTNYPTIKTITDNKLESDHPLDSGKINIFVTTIEELIVDIIPLIILNLELQPDQITRDWSKESVLFFADKTLSYPPYVTNKRPISESLFSKSLQFTENC